MPQMATNMLRAARGLEPGLAPYPRKNSNRPKKAKFVGGSRPHTSLRGEPGQNRMQRRLAKQKAKKS